MRVPVTQKNHRGFGTFLCHISATRSFRIKTKNLVDYYLSKNFSREGAQLSFMVAWSKGHWKKIPGWHDRDRKDIEKIFQGQLWLENFDGIGLRYPNHHQKGVYISSFDGPGTATRFHRHFRVRFDSTKWREMVKWFPSGFLPQVFALTAAQASLYP